MVFRKFCCSDFRNFRFRVKVFVSVVLFVLIHVVLENFRFSDGVFVGTVFFAFFVLILPICLVPYEFLSCAKLIFRKTKLSCTSFPVP